MATTTNYSWTTPDDTALVKDGAAAIRSLGTAIDTTVFNNASAAIAKTIVDAKGDIIAATAADTVSRLAVGANDTVLTADSSTATGLKWAAVAGGSMTLLSTTTLSGASTTISSISGSYKALKIRIIDFDPSDNTGVTFRMRFNSDTTTSYSTRTGNASNEAYGDAHINIAVNMSSTTVVSFAEIYIPEYANTNIRKTCTMLSHAANYFAPTGMDFGWRFGVWDDTAAINELTFYNSAGNWDGGTVYVYGVN